MVSSKAATVKKYLAELPPERRAVMEEVRRTLLKNMPKGYEEIMMYGMMGYAVPLSTYPDGYHCKKDQPLPYIALAAQKNAYSLYLMHPWVGEEERAQFEADWKKTGKKLDMGKSCIRFRNVDDLALEVIGKSIRKIPVQKWIEIYEKNIKR